LKIRKRKGKKFKRKWTFSSTPFGTSEIAGKNGRIQYLMSINFIIHKQMKKKKIKGKKSTRLIDRKTTVQLC
jgi:hypothetical protein